MALVDNGWQRTVTLCGLYVAQGVPWGFMLITLPAWLSSQFGVKETELGKLTAIILLPWSFKLLWAPLVDSFTIRSMGRRRPWILGAELMMALTLLGFLGLRDPQHHLNYILAMYFLHNCFASLQDLCTDALAIDVLPFQEQGQMNGLMWGSKLVGKGVGAWALSLVLTRAGLEACILVQVAILLAIMLIPLLILERPGEKHLPWTRGEAAPIAGAVVRSPAGVAREFLRAFSIGTTLIYIVFTLSKLIGVGINEIITNTLLTQRVGSVWTATEYSTVKGLYATVPIIFGALFGGILSDRLGRRPILIAGYGGFGLAAFAFAAFPGLWNDRWFPTVYLLGCETLAAIGSVGFLSMAMRISWTAAAATVFATYMTLSNVSQMIGNRLAGPVREFFRFGQTSPEADLTSYVYSFVVVGAVSMVPLLLLPWVRPEQVDRCKEADLADVEDEER